MQTLTSAKRVIRLLACLNVITIFTSVMIISSGMFVANAMISKCPSGTSSNAKLLKASLDGDYSGKMENLSGRATMDTFTISFTTDSNNNLVPTDFSPTAVADDSKPIPASKGGGIGMDLAHGTGTKKKPDGSQFSPQTPIQFSIATNDQTDDKGHPVIIVFDITNAQPVKGTWTVTNTGSKYDKFSGLFTLTSSDS